LAFSYLWEAEFFSRLHAAIVKVSDGVQVSDALLPLATMLHEGVPLAPIEPSAIPASQKGLWPALANLIARGYEARRVIYGWDALDPLMPSGATLLEKVASWLSAIPPVMLNALPKRIEPAPRTANNQKEFVRYLMLSRSSDDDVVDQADFYFLARNNSRHFWLHPGPEWLVVVASLVCGTPGGSCTLGKLLTDLAGLGIRVERSVVLELLEEAGLSADSPDADNAIIVSSAF
jgi:hypothetical protein